MPLLAVLDVSKPYQVPHSEVEVLWFSMLVSFALLEMAGMLLHVMCAVVSCLKLFKREKRMLLCYLMSYLACWDHIKVNWNATSQRYNKGVPLSYSGVGADLGVRIIRLSFLGWKAPSAVWHLGLCHLAKRWPSLPSFWAVNVT